MHLERVLVAHNRRSNPDGSYPDFENRHMEGALKYTEIADNIDTFYYSDHSPNCDGALIDYCLQKKPQAVLLSLGGMVQKGHALPSPDAVGKVTHQLHIPTVVFWFDIHSDDYADLLERYLPSVTLNMIGGADSSSHRPMALEGTNYVYSMVALDDRPFNIPEGMRDIPVGFLGSVKGNRSQWLEELNKSGIPVYIGGGQNTAGWMSYEEYCRLTSRMKITLNFSSVGNEPIALGDSRRYSDVLHWLSSQLKTWFTVLVRNPSKLKYALPALRSTSTSLSATLKKPRHWIRIRVNEALWLRTFLLEEDNPVTSQYFEPYVDYVPFSNLKDLVEKVRYYLENDEERDRIRMHGRATVEKYYNARLFFENLFEAMGLASGNQYPHHPGEIWNREHFDKWLLSKNRIVSG